MNKFNIPITTVNSNFQHISNRIWHFNIKDVNPENLKNWRTNGGKLYYQKYKSRIFNSVLFGFGIGINEKNKTT